MNLTPEEYDLIQKFRKKSLDVYLIVKGDFIDGLGEQILEMEELGVLDMRGDAEIYYYYSADLNVTYIRFEGDFWTLPVASLLSLLREKGFPHIVEANKPVPFILNHQPTDELIEKDGKPFLPMLGSIQTFLEHSDRITRYENVAATAKELAELPTRD